MDNFCGVKASLVKASLVVRRGAFDKAGYFDESLVSYEDYTLCPAYWEPQESRT